MMLALRTEEDASVSCRAVDRAWEPKMEKGRREEHYRLWKKAVTRSFDWSEEAAP